ncbi:proline racemase family protein [Flavobacteriaceae bacterium F89]|uniref:Proline racemase family protein n=1 Tax=Cerina litoralis TaxID=2874477 RepID=A0AAE3EVK6_9FLAO|nr:proline racemase family protein [Cerina litoralis]MCG2460447.1 proline racemase family protein [Cerina litoralis]
MYNKIRKTTSFIAPEGWLQIKTIDMHTGGEPLRVILEGFPELKGNSVLAYRQDCKQNHDYLRTAFMYEPRGHKDMYGCVLTPPNDEGADFGVLFLHNEGYSTMCGHAIIAIATLAVKMQWINAKEGDNILKIDAPCGRITSFVNIKNQKINTVRFHCVPSFVVGLDRRVKVPGLGTITYDLAYGGAFYAYVDMEKNNFDFSLLSENLKEITRVGMEIKHAVVETDKEIVHPFEHDLSFLYGTIFIEKSDQPDIDSKNVCIFANGEVDRSPTGSGVSGRMAIHKARKELEIGDSMAIQGITGSVFRGSIIEELEFGKFKAVIPQVSGTAYITGEHNFLIDPEDPFAAGFLLG